MNACRIEGCGKPRKGGYRMCAMHVSRKQRYGDPLINLREPVAPITRILLRTTIDADGCWRCWFKSAGRAGHVTVGVGGRRSKLAHRVMWESQHGPIPAGLVVRHSCDVPSCVNPDHLLIGTVADNNRDRDERGRHVALLGSRNGFAKLDEDQVRRIKAMLLDGASQYDVADRFGVHQATVSGIALGKRWRHVTLSKGVAS